MIINSEYYDSFLKLYKLYSESLNSKLDGRKLTLTCKDSIRALNTIDKNYSPQILGEDGQISIDLYTKHFRIFKNKDTFFKDFFEKELNIDFAIICYKDDSFLFFSRNDKKIFELDSDQLIESKSRLVSNTIFFKKIRDELVAEKLAIYNDQTKNELIIVSTSGREAFNLGYPQIQEELADYDLELIFNNLHKEIERKDFIPFFNNEICKTLSSVNVGSRYVEFIKQYESIIKSATLDFEIYLKDFSFDKVKTKFRESRDKYLQALQDVNSKFSSKLGSLVISVAASVFATFRIKDEARSFSGLLVLAVYIVYTLYSSYEIACLKEDILIIKTNFDRELQEVYVKSPIIAENLEQDSSQIKGKIENILKRLPILYLVVKGLNLLALVFIFLESFQDMYLPAFAFSAVIACIQYCYFGKTLFTDVEQ